MVKHPSFKEAFCFWMLLGFISFGGPTGQMIDGLGLAETAKTIRLVLAKP